MPAKKPAPLASPSPPVEDDPFLPEFDLPETTTLPGFSMSDDPPEDEMPRNLPGEALERRSGLGAIPHPPSPQNAPTAPPRGGNLANPADPTPLPNQGIAEATVPIRGADMHYESRIRILEAWQYPGNIATRPSWVDPNWIGYVEYDEVRKLEPGPCLRVPVEGAQAEKICRRGDYIVRQEIVLAQGVSDTRLEVWERDDFQKFFMPVMPERSQGGEAT